jgi:hypothetical protein
LRLGSRLYRHKIKKHNRKVRKGLRNDREEF